MDEVDLAHSLPCMWKFAWRPQDGSSQEGSCPLSKVLHTIHNNQGILDLEGGIITMLHNHVNFFKKLMGTRKVSSCLKLMQNWCSFDNSIKIFRGTIVVAWSFWHKSKRQQQERQGANHAQGGEGEPPRYTYRFKGIGSSRQHRRRLERPRQKLKSYKVR